MAYKDVCVAYLLWFFLGFFGAHRFYLNRPCSGVFYFFTIGGFVIGWFIDICLIPVMVDEENTKYDSRNKTTTATINVVQTTTTTGVAPVYVQPQQPQQGYPPQQFSPPPPPQQGYPPQQYPPQQYPQQYPPSPQQQTHNPYGQPNQAMPAPVYYPQATNIPQQQQIYQQPPGYHQPLPPQVPTVPPPYSPQPPQTASAPVSSDDHNINKIDP